MGQRWLEFLDRERRYSGRNPNVPYNFSSLSDLGAQWVELVAGGENQALRGHSLWRCGAAQTWVVGARGPLLQLMGGWQTPSVALAYASPKHLWVF